MGFSDVSTGNNAVEYLTGELSSIIASQNDAVEVESSESELSSSG